MLADAFRAESLRFLRQRGAILWGFGFFPALMLLLALGTAFFVRTHVHQKMPGAASVAESLFRNIHYASAPPDQLFVLLAAGALFAGDYRWETWRLLTPRNSRTTLLLGKLGVYALACLAGLALLGLSGVLQTVLGAAIDGSSIAMPDVSAAFFGQLGLSLATAWLDLMLLGELALLIAILTRSNIAAIMVPFGLFCVQAFVVSQIHGADRIQPPLKYLVTLPSLSVDVLRGTVLGPGGEQATGAGLAGLCVVVWLLGLAAAALALFQRQDLTRE
jgi:ABC-2 type transport system permease protein